MDHSIPAAITPIVGIAHLDVQNARMVSWKQKTQNTVALMITVDSMLKSAQVAVKDIWVSDQVLIRILLDAQTILIANTKKNCQYSR